MKNIPNWLTALACLLACAATAESKVQEDPDRAIYDFAVAAPTADRSVLKLTLGTPEAKLAPGRATSSFSVHLKSGEGWYAYPAPIVPAKNGRTVYLPIEAFQKDAAAAGMEKIASVRVSAWGEKMPQAPGATPPAAGGMPAAEFVKPTVGVVASGAFDPNRIRGRLGAPARFFRADDYDGMKAFVKGGGKLVVAYSADPKLAEIVGVAPGRWREVNVAALGADGKILCTYKTTNVIPPQIPAKDKFHARVTASLLDAKLHDMGAAGIIETDNGRWYAHGVPPPVMAPGALDLADAPETRGVWTDGTALDADGWAGMAPRLARAGFNNVYLQDDAPNFAEVLRECHRAGLKVHAWMISFGPKRSPDSKADRDALAARVRAAAKRGVDGVELDYFRYQQGARTDADTLTRLLEGLHSIIKFGHPGMTLSVAVFPVPKSRQEVGQDVAAWLRAGLVDYVSPMCYTESADEFARMIKANLDEATSNKQKAESGGTASARRNETAGRFVIGIGCGADESRLDAAGIAAQAKAAKAAGLKGVALFMLDAELAARLKR